MVPFPLLTPQTLLWTRLPPVARLNTRGPQGRLVLQGSTLDRSGAFRRTRRTLCTVWPRTVMRGKSRKLTSGSESVQKSARRTEPSPRNPRFAARPKGVAARRKVWGVKRGQETILGVLSPFAPRRGYGVSAGRPRQSPRRGHGVFSAARRRRLPAAFGGNFYDGRQFPSFTQVVSLSRTIVTIYPFLPKLSATIRPSAVWKI